MGKDTKSPKKAAPKEKTAGKKAGPKKDPEAPKRGLSSYMIFANERRPSMKKEEPSLGFGPLTKAIAAEWNVMGEAERAPYVKKATADKERAAKAQKEYADSGKKKAWETAHPKEAATKKKATKKKKDASSGEEEAESESSE